MHTRQRRGFTLIELMLVLVIIGALAAMVLPRFTKRGEQAKVTVARTDVLVNIPTALSMYEVDNGDFPGSDEGLNALVSKPASASNWKGPYLEKRQVPVDPWGRQYQYKSPGDHRPEDYDLYSLGKDGVESNDDITNW